MKLFAVALTVLASLAFVVTAQAHAEPVKAKPGNNAVLTAAPLSVELEMGQEMARQEGANDIDVFDAAGKEVTSTAAVIDNGNRRKLSVAMPSTLTPGVYTVKWKTRSADDGDAATGQLAFTFDPAGKADPGTEVIREILGATPESTASAPAVGAANEGEGTSWILIVSVALGMFVLGAGCSYLLVQRRP